MHLPIEHESVLTIVVAPKRPFRRRRLGKESIEIFLQRHIGLIKYYLKSNTIILKLWIFMVKKQPKYESISEIIDFELEFLSFFRKF